MLWLFVRDLLRSPRRLLLATVGVAFPVAMLGATLLFVDGAISTMTRQALAPVQVEMRALATSLDVDMNAVDKQLAAVPGVERVDRFAAADVVVTAPGANRLPARLFAVDQSYLDNNRWVRASAPVGNGALLGTPIPNAGSITIDLPGDLPEDVAPLALTMPVTGTADLRQAYTWFSIPLGDVQGDIANVPRSIVIDYPTFERTVLPALKRVPADGNAAVVFNQGATDLPPASLESHISVDHSAYPADPAQAERWSTTLRRLLERQSPGSIVVADDAAEALLMAKEDATNAKILFLLLGIPGALVAAGLGLAAASALVAAQRREEALLRLRGATTGQLARLTTAHATVASILGAALGLVVAAAAVAAVTGRQVWRQVPTDRLLVTAGVAVAAGVLTTAVRLAPLIRAGRKEDTGVVAERRLVERDRPRGIRLELTLIAVAVAVLGVNLLTGGLRQAPMEGQTLALAFYVLLAPLALWFAVTLLLIRGLRALLVRWARRPRPLGTWFAAALRWLGRRPARTGTALVLGALAIAFGTYVVTFAATYDAARYADSRAAFGSDLRLIAGTDQSAPPAAPGTTSTTPVHYIPSRVGTDRKSLMAIDPATYRRTATVPPSLISGQGVEALARDPNAVLVHAEIADGFGVGAGDTLSITVFPDDPGRKRNLNLRVAGVYRAFPPADPFAEMVTTAAAIPPPLPAPDFYLARTAPGRAPAAVAAEIRRAAPTFTVTTIATQVIREQRSLTTLDLRGLGRLESVAAALVAAVGVAVLGAFLVLERRRESAVMRSVGATTGQVLTPPAVESGIAVVGSLLIGIPVGIGLAILAVRVLGLFFTLPPPLYVLPAGALATIGGFMVGLSAVATGLALFVVARQDPAPVLREP